MEGTLLIETIIQVLFAIFIAPLFAGIMLKLKANVESRKGPSIFQPYFDLIKLIKKEVLIPSSSGIFFKIGPYISFSIYILISFIIPVLIPTPIIFTASADFLGGALLFATASFVKLLAAFDSGSNYAKLGASRIMSFNFLSEGTLITVFFGVSILTGTDNPYITHDLLISNPLSNLSLLHLFSSLAFFMLFLFETGKLPLESKGVHELGMIDAGLNFEYSGKLLALNEWGSYIKQYLLGSVLINVFLLPWGLFSGFPSFLIDIPVMFLKWMILIIIVTIIETSLAKLRLFRIIDYLAVAFTFSVLFLIFSEVMFV
ncbi:MAG: respiratory chain complex I subunit 1 family protein [Thermoplasmata archaeon]